MNTTVGIRTAGQFSDRGVELAADNPAYFLAQSFAGPQSVLHGWRPRQYKNRKKNN